MRDARPKPTSFTKVSGMDAQMEPRSIPGKYGLERHAKVTTDASWRQVLTLGFGVTQQELDDLVAGAGQRLEPDDIVGLGENPGLALERQFVPA